MYYLPSGLPRDHVARFARHALPPLDTLGREPLTGWVTGRHLLDRLVVEESCRPAGYLRLTLARAERKIPEALLRAECAMEELAELQASGLDIVPRARRTEIRRSLVERLLPTMPPTLSGIPWVFDEEGGVLYAGATSDKQSDAFVIAFRHTAGVAPVPVTPEVAALKRSQLNARDLSPTSFSDELDDKLAGDNLGMDFLTWLWFYSEARGGTLASDQGEFAVAVEGPLMFVMEGEGAHVALLRKGAPQLSAEARTSLVSGKKLARARITLARGEMSWSFNLDAPSLVLRGVKLPKEDGLDAISRFHGRMLMLAALRDALFAFFDAFNAERFSAKVWPRTRDDMRRWARDRAGKI
jgi:hypothetical protein